ncbi:class I adenylate-forming enzyme family protein [Mycobacterium branderi]|uniref:AMP-dependent synthetase n=1 Tax=Mycobacterium branderi TaxID=43348 RepID=A0A7I7WDQ3_9MYCO|nr:class I adenylate-forming enzyme family protein [Mycobacterium branderi]MCV7235195.1 acyl--CoA ligase [Mycobacterium branderi]ORA31843.1 AMP-dependent synthetase [Mycobacterium branderi]BBZ14965.1 malonyl-CoA synthase [Mycobacterium branderi]
MHLPESSVRIEGGGRAVVLPDILGVLDWHGGAGVALEDAQRSVGYPDLGASVRSLAAALALHGISPGDRVAIMVSNSAAAVELYLACALIGAIWVGINPAAPQAERDRQLALVTPTLIVTDTASSSPLGGRTVELAALFADRAHSYDAAPPEPETACAIGFSSGTTGTPKALVHSRAGVSLIAATLARVQLRADDRVGVILPMSIHNLMAVGALPALFAGATCVAVTRMNAAGVAAACRERRLTMVNALVPATIYDLVHDNTIAPEALASLRVAGTGAAGLSEDLRSAFEAKFGVRVIGTYGMTEAPGVVCIEDPALPHIPGGCGKALPHLAVRAYDEQYVRLPAGQEGELVVCAADSGAWAGIYRPALGTWTERGLIPRGRDEKCFRTGDYGWVDADGTVHVSGRTADVIVRGGVNINAAELESVLGQLPGVRDIAVIGEPDARLGQRIVAFVEPVSGATVDAAQLRERARHVLSHNKVPDEFVGAVLPRNAMGKVARTQLRRPTPRRTDLRRR